MWCHTTYLYSNKMAFKFKLLVALAATCFCEAAAQPAACNEDSQCSPGFFCEDRVHMCSKCLHCKDLGREELGSGCVKSVLECGPCLKGLVDSRLDCVPAAAEASDGLPIYNWVLIGLAVVFFICLIIFVMIIIKKGDILHSLKISAAPSRCTPAPSAPELPSNQPPPYDSVVSCSNSDRLHPSNIEMLEQPEDERSLLKRTGSWRGGGREAEGRQVAVPFNDPIYSNGPPSDIPTEISEPRSPLPPDDEETLESMWTPNEPVTTNTSTIVNTIGGCTVQEVPSTEDEAEAEAGQAAAAPGALAARTRRGSGDAGPPRKLLRRPQEDPQRPSNADEQQEQQQQQPDSRGPIAFFIHNVTNVNLSGL